MRYDESGEGSVLVYLSFSYPQVHYVPAGICKKGVVDLAWSEMGPQDKENYRIRN